MRTALCEIGMKYGTDKCPEIRHSYTPVYHEIFGDKRNDIRKVLEIGIGVAKKIDSYTTGASLLMWRDYFPNAMIYGVDILKESMVSGDRIKTFIGDQYNKEDLQRLISEIGSDIDIVIDDGSHDPEHQVFTAKNLIPMLKKDVIYIIEDVFHCNSVVENLSQFFDCKLLSLDFYSDKLKKSKKRDNNMLILKNL